MPFLLYKKLKERGYNKKFRKQIILLLSVDNMIKVSYNRNCVKK